MQIINYNLSICITLLSFSSADCGVYDVKLDKTLATSIGLQRESVINTIKIYTGPKSRMGQKIGELPENKKREFIQKYRAYQQDIINQFQI